MEVIDIGLSDLEPISIKLQDNETSSVNFGPGAEFLMNDRNAHSGSSTKVDMSDLDNLEKELNTLSDDIPQTGQSSAGVLGGFSNFFTSTDTPSDQPTIIKEMPMSDSNIGAATVESIGTTKTWDGFGKINEVPSQKNASSSNLTDREKRRKKRAMIKKLEEWYDKGLIKHNSNFNMDADFDEVEDEYETALDDKRKKDSVKLQGWWFTTLVNSLEYANAAFDPFGVNLDGWGEQINEDIDSYEEIFTELHDKYKGGKMSPEVSLLLRLGFSGAVLNITNKALSTATPGFNDVIRQSPELMKMFSAATTQAMGQQQNPGFDFVNSVLHPDEQAKTSFGVPPAPVKTQEYAPPSRPGMQYTQNAESNRPDIAMGRGSMFKEEGVNMSNKFADISEQPQRRPEMRGPQTTDLDSLLSGLKTSNPPPRQTDGDSMVSITSLQDGQNTNLPKRTRQRKQRSDKNIIALDI